MKLRPHVEYYSPAEVNAQSEGVTVNVQSEGVTVNAQSDGATILLSAIKTEPVDDFTSDTERADEHLGENTDDFTSDTERTDDHCGENTDDFTLDTKRVDAHFGEENIENTSMLMECENVKDEMLDTEGIAIYCCFKDRTCDHMDRTLDFLFIARRCGFAPQPWH
jgi:hypothetical protein